MPDNMDHLHQQLDAAEAEMREAERSLRGFAEIKPALAELVGHAETEDGRVRAEWTSEGLTEFELDPRAMRMPSSELAETVKQVVKDAMEDLRRQTLETLQGAGVVAPEMPDLNEVEGQFTKLRERMMDNARLSARDLEKAHQHRQQYDER